MALARVMRTRTFRWGVNTIASFVVTLGVTAALHEVVGVDASVSYAIALVTAFFMNFLLLRYYTFGHSAPLPVRSQFAVYTASTIGFRGVEYGAFLLVHTLLGVQYAVTIVLVQGLSFIGKFFFYGRVVFRGADRPGDGHG